MAVTRVRGSSLEHVAAPRLFRISAIVCGLLAAALWVGPYLLRADLYADDAAQHLFWMYRFLDPGLFPNDLSVTYFADSSAAPWGYQVIYFLLSRLLDPQMAAEIVAVALVLLSALLAWKLGVACGDDQPQLRGLFAIVAVAVLLPFKAMDLVTPLGLQRSFALPLTLLCLWALVSRRYAWVGVSWLAAALIYPVIIVVLGLTGGLFFLWEWIRDRRLPPAFIWNGVLGVSALGVALMNVDTPPGIGPTVTGSEAMEMPEFFPGGRLPMFGMSAAAMWFADHHIALGWPRRVLALLVLALGTALLYRRKAVPAAGWVMLAVGLGVWFISRQVLFELYLPNRHSRWTLACFAALAFSGAAYAVFVFVRQRLNSVKRASQILSWTVALAAPVVVAAVLIPEAAAAWRMSRNPDMERAYAFIATLPKDTLVAAHPDVADFVPLRSRRSVLVSTEISLPFMLGYYNQLKPRIQASLRAAYATSMADVDAVLAPHDVDVLLTNASVWDKQNYYAPFNELTAALRKRGDAEGYALRSPPPDRVLFRSGDVYVVRVAPGQ